MKRRKELYAAVCLLCTLLLADIAPAAQAADVRASVAVGKVTLNGQTMDNSTAEYPLLEYRDITYFPMTYHMCRFLGLSTDWNNVSRTLTISRTGPGDYVPDTGHARKKGSVTASRVDYPVIVNGQAVDQSGTRWPLINYSGVTYFPLTWDFAVTQFGWSYHWDASSGLEIESCADSAGDFTEGEIILGAGRGWGPAAFGSSPENLTVELTGEWTLDAIKAAIGNGLAEHVKGTRLEGRLSNVEIPYTFQFPASMKTGDVLKVPYTASYDGDTITLPSGKTFTPGSTAEEAVASVQLGQGWQGPADAGFLAGQEIYRKLEACARIPTLTAVSGAEGFYDLSAAIEEAINKNLKAADLPYMVTALASGSYVNPYWTDPGYSQDFAFTVSFTATAADAPAESGHFTVSAQGTLLTVEK